MDEKELLELANSKGWDYISIYQKLSSSFIAKYKDKVLPEVNKIIKKHKRFA